MRHILMNQHHVFLNFNKNPSFYLHRSIYSNRPKFPVKQSIYLCVFFLFHKKKWLKTISFKSYTVYISISEIFILDDDVSRLEIDEWESWSSVINRRVIKLSWITVDNCGSSCQARCSTKYSPKYCNTQRKFVRTLSRRSTVSKGRMSRGFSQVVAVVRVRFSQDEGLADCRVPRCYRFLLATLIPLFPPTYSPSFPSSLRHALLLQSLRNPIISAAYILWLLLY